jgi:hypothetical protein
LHQVGNVSAEPNFHLLRRFRNQPKLFGVSLSGGIGGGDLEAIFGQRDPVDPVYREKSLSARPMGISRRIKALLVQDKRVGIDSIDQSLAHVGFLIGDLYRELQQERFAKLGGASELLTGMSPAPAPRQKDDLAAWTLVANVMLNLDETQTKE